LELIKLSLVQTVGHGDDGRAVLTAAGEAEFEKMRDPA
jgi:hypothetical protein